MNFKERPIVKLLVRRVGSNRFLNAAGRWTRKVEAAFNFPSLLNAYNTCTLKKVKDAELIVKFDGDRVDRSYPISALL
jgi:hypothetical protein